MSAGFYRLDDGAPATVSRLVMRRLLVLLLISSLAAASALAYEEPRLTPEYLVINVGETKPVDVRILHLSGLNYTMWRFVFHSSDESVMFTSGEFSHPRWNGTIYVEARAPGVADIIAGGRSWGRVQVFCTVEEPIAALNPHERISRNGTVRLSVTSTAAGRVLQWYSGRAGDTSHPLPGTTPDYLFTASAPGTHYVWASARTPCSTSTAEFRIDVTQQPRRRSVGRR